MRQEPRRPEGFSPEPELANQVRPLHVPYPSESPYRGQRTEEGWVTWCATEDLQIEVQYLKRCITILEARALSDGTRPSPDGLVDVDDFPDLEIFLDAYARHKNGKLLPRSVEDEPDLDWQHAFWLRMYMLKRFPEPVKALKFPQFARLCSDEYANLSDDAMEKVSHKVVRDVIFYDLIATYELEDGVLSMMDRVKEKHWQVGPYLGLDSFLTVQYLRMLERRYGCYLF